MLAARSADNSSEELAWGRGPPPSLGMLRVNRALGTTDSEIPLGPLRSVGVVGSGLERVFLGRRNSTQSKYSVNSWGREV